jgi:uncharacterized SAM-binding protein YcdF (DUF218 family)
MNTIRTWFSRIRLRHVVRAVFVLGVLWVMAMAVLYAGIYAYGGERNAEPSDVIIVLGSGLRRDGRAGDALYRRSVWAARLYADGMAPAVICTGGFGQGLANSEAAACRDVLLRQGVPDAAIFLDEDSRSTEENATFARDIVIGQGWQTAIVVTDSFHMLRADWIFRDYFDGPYGDLAASGLALTHTRSPVPRDWVRTYFYVRHSAREVIALQWQAFKELFNLPYTRVG